MQVVCGSGTINCVKCGKGKGSMEVFVNIPSCIVGMTLGSMLLAGAGIGVMWVMLVMGWTTTGTDLAVCASGCNRH